MSNTEYLNKEIEQLKERNKRVELDKAWETSWFRIVLITFITYIIATVVIYFINIEKPFLSALIPTIGFFLSTQSLPLVKKWWIEKKITNRK
tara:strand:+ start:18 stop:293 length:276 start_codon:yes stop_codon:yes gene_type:complete